MSAFSNMNIGWPSHQVSSTCGRVPSSGLRRMAYRPSSTCADLRRGSPRSPNTIARSGQASTHAGGRPVGQPLLAQVALLDDARVSAWGSRLVGWATNGRGSTQLKLRDPYGHAATQYRQPMQRCSSIVTTPSSRFHVAPAGHTRTQGGLSQWLQRTRTGCGREGPR